MSTTPIIFYTSSTNIFSASGVSDEPEIWFTMKSNAMLPDNLSTVQISKTGSLIYTNGTSACSAGLTPNYGNITVSSGSIATITISASAAPILHGNLPNDFVGEIKTKTIANVITVVTQFPIEVKPSLTQSI